MAMNKMIGSDEFGDSRRRFLKGLLATGALVAMPCGLLVPRDARAEPFDPKLFQVFRSACPRNCYATCSIKSYVRDGVVKFVEGAEESSYTHGGLCVKGYSYTRRPYSPDRVKYPMVQDGRRSGKWRRVSWDEAMQRICEKILAIKQRDGSLLGLALTKYSGNFGITNYCVEGMMSSLGYTSRFIGTPCWPAGIDAQTYDFGSMWANDPEDMVHSKYIILWGCNPAACSVHSMKFIYDAQQRGAKVVVIDPIFTETAAKADLYWKPNVATDGALALGMARHILDLGLYDKNFVNTHALGFNDFATYLREKVTVEWAAEVSGIPAEQIRAVAEEFVSVKPATVWIGYGLQRHTNGGATVRTIDALVAMSGNVGLVGGGARYGQVETWGFSYYGMTQKPPKGSRGMIGGKAPKGEFDSNKADHAEYANRLLNINKTAQEILDAKDPKISILWSSCKNPFAQDFERNKLQKAFDGIDLVVSVEQFFTETVANSDIVLPVTTLFEEWTVDVSYWQYWLSINEQAIKPMHEAKSNLDIAMALSRKMNELMPGSCTFPQQGDTKSFTIKEFNKNILDMFAIASWEDLLQGPRKARMPSSASWYDFKFKTPSGKYEFKSELCAKNGFNALPVYVQGRKPYAPYRLLTPHTKFGIHSQFINLDWMREFDPEPYVYIHPSLAESKGISELDMVRVHNKYGEVRLRAKLSTNVQPDCLVMYEAWYPDIDYNVQNLVDDESADMGAMVTGAPGVAIHDQFADIQRV